MGSGRRAESGVGAEGLSSIGFGWICPGIDGANNGVKNDVKNDVKNAA